MIHAEIKREITLLREWKSKALAIPPEQTPSRVRQEWVQEWVTSDDGKGHYTQVGFASISRWTLAKYIQMDEYPRSISYIISMCDYTPIGGCSDFSQILVLVDRKIKLLQEEIELTGKIRCQMYHDSYPFAEPTFHVVFSAADFYSLKGTISHNLAVVRAISTVYDGSWWASFSRFDESTGKYEESLHLFQQRIKM